jgi:hypothetical protein
MKAKLNPFRSARAGEFRYRLGDAGWTRVLGRLEALHYRGAVTGPHGTGKTTFLEDLRVRLEGMGLSTRWIEFQDGYSRADRRRLSHFLDTPDPGTLLMLDGWDWLPLPDQWRVRCSLNPWKGILVTVHRRPPFPTLWETRIQPEIAREMVVHFLNRPLDQEEEQLLTDSFTRHNGNIREVLRAFYFFSARGREPVVPAPS